ncbi:MAG: prolyl aminopeptidase [Limnohabitans sp.]
MFDTTLHDLYPPIEPYEHGFLPEKDGHSVYFEACGNPNGFPVVFLHGGPGSGCGPRHRQLFHPSNVRAVLFDQRGCGRSLSQKALQANTTAHLIHDIERLREHLRIEKWLVVGGSWGGGLGLAYASAHPDRCSGAVIRGVFLSRPSDLQWFFEDAKQCMPDAWAAFQRQINALGNPLWQILFDGLLHGEEGQALRMALAWQDWENALTNRHYQNKPLPRPSAQEATALLAKYRLQSHYLQHLCFFPPQGLLPHVNHLSHMPVSLIHGRLDWICRPEAAWAAHQAIGGSRLQMIDNAGHNPFEAPMTEALVRDIHTMVDQLRANG